MKKILLLPLCVLFLLADEACLPSSGSQETTASSLAEEWQEAPNITKPWTRWWWHGSSVSRAGITQELEAFQQAGIGGVELTPIYGVIGEEASFIPFLSPEWVDMLEFTLQEAERLGLGVDMATGTGWPFGGPWVSPADASHYLAHQHWTVKGGERFHQTLSYSQPPILRTVFNRSSHWYDQMQAQGKSTDSLPVDLDWGAINDRPSIENLTSPIQENKQLQRLAADQVRFPQALPMVCVMAYNDEGARIELTNRVGEDLRLDWTAPDGNWTLYALYQGWHGKMVERAAPGGEGPVIDHFSADAIQHYLSRFDSAFQEKSLSHLRAFFNDSYEVDDAAGEANWTPDFLEAFQEKRGYDLKLHLPALLGEDTGENHQRVLSDFRETLSDLLLETFTQKWKDWAHGKEKIIRNQAHGSPANILDLYAASDIPETEGTDVIRAKFASSAANVSGKKLISAEAATWLGEHFTTNFGDLKQNLDRYFVSGVNHIFYHGSCYSPPGEPWPGRLFYAAIHANPRNPQWRHFPYFNQYVARTQSVLQSGNPHNDMLLYYPMYDRFATPGNGLLDHFDGHGPHLEATEVKGTADFLWDNGYTFDFISDRQISRLQNQGTQLISQGNEYQLLVLPKVDYLPLASLKKIIDLAKSGANIVIHRNLPKSFPGNQDKDLRQAQFDSLLQQLDFQPSQNSIQIASIGKGKILLGNELEKMLSYVGVLREKLVDTGLEFVRRTTPEANYYFVSNWSGKEVRQWIPINTTAENVLILDPMSGKEGLAQTRNISEDQWEVRLAIQHGASLILKTTPPTAMPKWEYYQQEEIIHPLTQNWTVSFVEGGPVLPSTFQVEKIAFWTDQQDESYQHFSGTGKYEYVMGRPKGQVAGWMLDLGEVHETAQVSLNGEVVGTLIGPTYKVFLDSALFLENNLLEIEVTNLMANRIVGLEEKGVFWKKFYNINLSARKRENLGPAGVFDASKWGVMPSGLAGPIRLIGMQKLYP